MSTEKIVDGWIIKYRKHAYYPISQVFLTEKDALKFLPIFEGRGWTGGIEKIKHVKIILSEEEKIALKNSQRALNEMVNLI